MFIFFIRLMYETCIFLTNVTHYACIILGRSNGKKGTNTFSLHAFMLTFFPFFYSLSLCVFNVIISYSDMFLTAVQCIIF